MLHLYLWLSAAHPRGWTLATGKSVQLDADGQTYCQQRELDRTNEWPRRRILIGQIRCFAATCAQRKGAGADSGVRLCRPT